MRRIYADFLAGATPSQIAADLTGEQIPTPMGRQRWSVSTINSILRNEKYKGDALTQKTFTVDFLSKKVKKNEGEVQQYYVTGHHEPIIDPAIWDRVQGELTRRSGRYVSRTHLFTKMIYCAECHGAFGRKTWHAGTQYERKIWRCNNKYGRHQTPCTTPHVTDADIEQAFVAALAERVRANTGARKALHILETSVLATSALEPQRDQAKREAEEAMALLDQLVHTAATNAIDPDEYDTRYAQLEARYNQAQAQQNKLQTAITDRQHRLNQARAISKYLETNPPLEFSNDAWALLVDHAEVGSDGTITITFKDQA